MPDKLPNEIRDFLAQNIASVAQLELLLLLRQQWEKRWSVAETAQACYISETMTEGLLVNLRRQGLIRQSAEGEYQYAPDSPELANLIDDLAAIYQQRRVTVIGLIHSAPIDTLRSFADAFRLRKPKEET